MIRLLEAAVAFLAVLPVLASDPSQSLEQAARVVVCLQHQVTISIPGTPPRSDWVGDGTGIIIKSAGQNLLVTARHVAECPYDLTARVFVNTDSRGAGAPLELRIPRDAWSFHREGPNPHLHSAGVDIAVAKIPEANRPQVGALTSCTDCDTNLSQLANDDPSPGDAVMVVGCPGNVGRSWIGGLARPTYRSASVFFVSAGEMLLPLDSGLADPAVFLLDRRAQPGNSGSAVFEVGDKIKLLGLAIAVDLDWDFTVVEPAYRILQAIPSAMTDSKSGLSTWTLPGERKPDQ